MLTSDIHQNTTGWKHTEQKSWFKLYFNATVLIIRSRRRETTPQEVWGVEKHVTETSVRSRKHLIWGQTHIYSDHHLLLSAPINWCLNIRNENVLFPVLWPSCKVNRSYEGSTQLSICGAFLHSNMWRPYFNPLHCSFWQWRIKHLVFINAVVKLNSVIDFILYSDQTMYEVVSILLRDCIDCI